MSDSLETTREELRRYLLPQSTRAIGDDNYGDHFPRSKVMRFAFNPRNRHLLVFSGSVLAVLASRMVGANRIGMVADVIRSLKRRKG